MTEITFTIEACHETGGFVARWDDAPGKGGITTQGDSFAELDAMIADAVKGYFEPSGYANSFKKKRVIAGKLGIAPGSAR